MANTEENEYDREFEAELEKAKALSMETLAMEQFRRNKIQHSVSDVTANALTKYKNSLPSYAEVMSSQDNQTYQRPRPGSLNAPPIGFINTQTGINIINTLNNNNSTVIAPPPSVPSRRHSETKNLYTNANLSVNDSNKKPQDTDLISFTSPTANQNLNNVDNNDSHANLLQYCEQIHRMQNDVNITKQYRSNSVTSTFNNYQTQSHTIGGNLQLIPYGLQTSTIYNATQSTLPVYQQQILPQTGLGLATIQQQQQQQQIINNNSNVPLTLDNLNKLYNMPYGLQQQSQQQPQTALINNQQAITYQGSNNLITGVLPSIGFQTHNQQQQPQTTYLPPNYANQNIYSLGSFKQQTPNVAIQQNIVTNPESALVHVPKVNNYPLKTLDLKSPTSPSTTPTILTPVAPVNNNNFPSTSGYAASTLNQQQQTQILPRKSVERKLGDDLIDLNCASMNDDSRVSVLEAFDPLLMGNKSSDYDDKGDTISENAYSYYSEYDPFDYLYSSGGTNYSDPVYEAVNKTERTPLSPPSGSGAPPIGWNIPFSSGALTPPPLPPRNAESLTSEENYQVLDRRKLPTKLYENVLVRKSYESELMAFYNMVIDLRAEYKYTEQKTNVGHVVACQFISQYPAGSSIKLLVHPAIECIESNLMNAMINNRHSTSIECNSTLNTGKGQIEGYGPPVVFTCDISTTVEHVIMHVFCELEGQIKGNVNDFVLKPIGVVEWLSPGSRLDQLECIHNSIKLEKDVQLGLCPKTMANMRVIARTLQDDIRDAEIKPSDILAHEPGSPISYDNLMILLETLETEIDRLESSAADSNPHTVLTCSGVVQAVKAICALLGSIDTLEITEAIAQLKGVCTSGQTVYSYKEPIYNGGKLDILSESGDYAEVSIRPRTILEQIKYRCHQVRDSIQNLLEVYSNAFRVDFSVDSPEYHSIPVPISNVSESVMVHIMCLHRPPMNWKHDDYILGAQIYHGTRYIGEAVVTQCSNEISGIYPRLKFESWLNFEGIPVCTLPRESRLIFVLYGCTTEPAEGGDNSKDKNDTNQEKKVTKVELGWCSIQFFDFERNMIRGQYLLTFWPPTTDKFLGPAPAKGTHPHAEMFPVLGIEIPNYGGRIVFPEPLTKPPPAPRFDFNSLDKNLQQELIDTAEQGYPNALDKREVLWEKRHYLQGLPHALPKVLHAAHSWDFASLVDLHALLKSWHPLTPLQALELLLPRYPDMEIRSNAVKWVSAMPNDQLVDYLPQLLQALKHDTYEASPMARFLLCRSLESPRVAHFLYWHLVHNLPGDSPQNTNETTQVEVDESLITQARYHRRNKMMLRALLATCGEKLSARFLAQNMMCKSLADVAQNVKLAKESMRQKTLVQGLESVNQILLERPTSLPLGPGLEVTGVNVRNCSYFNSNTLPLKINFLCPDGGLLPAIFKCGDDLQQDMLTLQLVRIMDKLWLKEGLDLKMVTFSCVPTGHKKGMIELVSDAETLRKIQIEFGLTGSFKDKPIAEWLAKQNPSQLEYQRAVDNFTVSCAGYSVATYILGICDRHNDNIMLKTSGHLFHIDFGKFLGDSQMFGNFKRDRTPFVLTSDMAYVINGGERPSTKFHHFVDLCCKAFNIVRKHGDLILHMLALMATSGIPGVTADAVTYVRRALLPGQSNPEAAASFAKMIHISLKSWFTQFNFFLHNLAQLRFTADEGSGELLSFVPRTYTMAQDGRLKSVTVHGYQKRYDLEKYYTYILKVTRQNQPDPSYLFRSYKEFSEFHQKLCLHFPLAKLHSLSSGIHVGRSNIKTVAERRLPEIRHFLISLFNSADEIAHSDLVYTFFHPLLRDQQEADIHVAKVKDVRPTTNSSERVCGEIKLSLQYHRGALTVMVHHARSLPVTTGGQEPNTYVKVYLKPDPTKATKRKTKVVRKNCFPSFMETLEYRMPIDYIHNRVLQVTVWSHDSLQENEFLGGVELKLSLFDLREEIIKWFQLGYLPRS